MEESSGSDINKVIGMGIKTNPFTKQTDLVSKTYYSYHGSIVEAFTNLPITQYFGLSIDKAMDLPLDQWFRIRDAARVLASKPKDESDTASMMQFLKEILTRQTE